MVSGNSAVAAVGMKLSILCDERDNISSKIINSTYGLEINKIGLINLVTVYERSLYQKEMKHTSKQSRE